MAKSAFSEDQLQAIEAAIAQAERKTSGELRVHIESRCKEDVMDHAAALFEALRMQETAERNGVLIYLAVDDHKFAILGDAGIHARVPHGFWDDAYAQSLPHLRHENWTKGLIAAIEAASTALAAHFPCRENDANELSDTISFGP